MTTATDVNGEVKEWCIKRVYPTGLIEYGDDLSRSIADEWEKEYNRSWGWLGIIHQVVHISERDK